MYRHLNIFSSKILVYYLVNYFSFFVFFLFCFIQLKKAGNHGVYFELLLKRFRNSVKIGLFLIILETFVLSFFMYPLAVETTGWNIGDLFYNFTGKTGAVVYFCWVFFSPIFLFVCALFIGRNFFKTLDSLTPAYPLALTYSKLACFCAGCCNGIAVDWGFYNYETRLREFPVQIVESAEALVIFFILMRIRKKVKLGTMFPLYLVFYSGMRFFSEFLRAQPDVLGPLKCAQIFCIGGIIFGFVGFILAEKYAERIDNAFGAFYAKIEKKLKRS